MNCLHCQLQILCGGRDFFGLLNVTVLNKQRLQTNSNQLRDQMRRQVVTDIRVPNSVWKKKVSDTLFELNIIPGNFSGKVVISFKDGGISYIEKTETLK